MNFDKFFNCMMGYVVFDWLKFDVLEIGGCVDDVSEDEKVKGEIFIIGGVDCD